MPLAVSANGRICELVRLAGRAALVELRLSGADGLVERRPVAIRGIGRFERIWRMASRVYGVAAQLSRAQRARLGLSMRKTVLDLAGAYRIAAEHRLPIAYPDWIASFDRLDETDRSMIRRHIAGFGDPPHFHVVLMAQEAGSEAVRASLASLQRQIYRSFSCAVLDGATAGVAMPPDDPGMARVQAHEMPAWLAGLNAALAARPARSWVLLLRAGDALAEHALYWFAWVSQRNPDAAILYSDDDALDRSGKRCWPRFKPDWSLLHVRATNYLGDAAAFRGDEVAAGGGITPECVRYGNYDLLLRVADRVGQAASGGIRHIPAVLLHRAFAGADTPYPAGEEAEAWRLRALHAHLGRNGASGEVVETLPGCWHIRYRLTEPPPFVSVIVPTRDAPALLRRCVESLLKKSTYPRFEILLVDNRSSDAEALAYLEEMAGDERVRVFRYERPFNYSAINNFAVKRARGEVLCLLNNDTEVITPAWLEEMLGLLCQQGVGIVGARLLYPDGTVQHGGDLVGVGEVASHAHAFLSREDPGYLGRAMLAQEMTAVTGACLMVRRALYEQLGGLDEENFPVAFNDVDFCLRARAQGWRIAWTPHAELYHDESASRGRSPNKERTRRIRREAARMRKRWQRALGQDPFYNPNLNQVWPDFSLSRAPKVERPWRAECRNHDNAKGEQ